MGKKPCQLRVTSSWLGEAAGSCQSLGCWGLSRAPSGVWRCLRGSMGGTEALPSRDARPPQLQGSPGLPGTLLLCRRQARTRGGALPSEDPESGQPGEVAKAEHPGEARLPPTREFVPGAGLARSCLLLPWEGRGARGAGGQGKGLGWAGGSPAFSGGDRIGVSPCHAPCRDPLVLWDTWADRKRWFAEPSAAGTGHFPFFVPVGQLLKQRHPRTAGPEPGLTPRGPSSPHPTQPRMATICSVRQGLHPTPFHPGDPRAGH